MALCDEARIGNVIDFADANLNLAGIATGAADELGLGPGSFEWSVTTNRP
jgi:hypothetical protein